jgi:monoamine oxidase
MRRTSPRRLRLREAGVCNLNLAYGMFLQPSRGATARLSLSGGVAPYIIAPTLAVQTAQRTSQDMTGAEETEILVIGAGLAGLTAAYILQQAGHHVRVLEGAARIGGRIHSACPLGDAHERVDLGPTWVWPKWQPVVAKWLEDLSVPQFDQYDQGDGILDGYGSTPYRQFLPGQDGISRIRGGPSSIVDALFLRLAPDTVVLKTKVAAIEPTATGLQATTAEGRTYTAGRIILAAPLRVITEQIDIPGLPKDLLHCMQTTPTWMAQQAKVVASFKAPFWRGTGLSGRVASRQGPLVEIHDHTPADATFAALFGFVGWPPEVRASDPDGLKTAIRNQISRCFGEEAERPEDLLVQDWSTERLICSTADLMGPPAHPDVGPDLLRHGHLGGRLWLAVSETADVSPGLIEGALNAGETAAERLRSSLSA